MQGVSWRAPPGTAAVRPRPTDALGRWSRSNGGARFDDGLESGVRTPPRVGAGGPQAQDDPAKLRPRGLDEQGELEVGEPADGSGRASAAPR